MKRKSIFDDQMGADERMAGIARTAGRLERFFWGMVFVVGFFALLALVDDAEDEFYPVEVSADVRP